MSHAYGEVYKDGHLIGHFDYHATVDTCCTRIFPSVEELNKHGGDTLHKDCTCGQPPTSVILYTDYGSGSHWTGEACLSCMAIVGGSDPYGDWDEEPRLRLPGRPLCRNSRD